MLASSMPWYWIGYNMLNDVPFYNLWSMEPGELEFINIFLNMLELVSSAEGDT